MFVVAGVSGNSGAAAARALIAAGQQVRGLTRNSARVNVPGVEPFETALDDVAALTRAFAGAAGAYLLCPPDLQHPDPIALYEAVAEAAAKAARGAGLPRLVLLSSIGAQLPSGTGPVVGLHKAEAILADAAPQVTFLRPASFMDNWRGLADAARNGVLPSFMVDVDARAPTVSTRDIGETAAALLLEDAPPRVVELEGPRPYSVRDVADAFGRALKREVQPVVIPREGWPEALAQAGFSSAYASLLQEMYSSLNNGLMRAEGVRDQRRGVVTIDQAIAAWV